MTNRNAQYRPHCVDLNTNSFHSVATEPHRGAARRQAKASERFARQGPKSPASATGAVRNASPYSPAPRYAHYGKVSFALSLIAAGIFWTTAGKSNETMEAPLVTVKASLAPPAFFFDDAVDALTAHFANSSTANTAKTIQADTSDAVSNGSTLASGEPGSAPVQDTLANASPFAQPAADFFDPLKSIATITPPAQPTSVTKTLSPLPNLPSLAAVRNKAIAPEGALTTVVAVASGNTLSGILNDHGVKIEQMPQLLTDSIVKDHLSNLEIDQELTVTQLPNGDFHSLTTRVGNDKRITIRRSANDFAVASIDLPVEKERVVTSGTIEQSLYLAAEQANLKQSTIMELADIFQWELDFAKDIRKGDQFSLVYDRLYRDGSYIGDGDILAAEFVRGGKTHRAIRFTTDDGTTGYYSPDGTSKRRTFKRHPVDVVRITSKFNPNRLHPVLHKIRAHRGVDYGSPYGSPIYATADGKVSFSGSKNAYGNTVILQHGKKFSTLYAHMSKISDKSNVGKRVKQGDVIGYVGKSGRVTGTHLHYEFRVNNVQIDPLKVELPAAQPIDDKYMAELKRVSDEMTEQMHSVLNNIDEQVATIAGDHAPAVLNKP